MTLTYDDLRTCYLCGTVRPVEQMQLLDTFDAEPTWRCRSVSACVYEWATRRIAATAATGSRAGFLPGLSVVRGPPA